MPGRDTIRFGFNISVDSRCHDNEIHCRDNDCKLRR
jgi:hypothetical protein